MDSMLRTIFLVFSWINSNFSRNGKVWSHIQLSCTAKVTKFQQQLPKLQIMAELHQKVIRHLLVGEAAGAISHCFSLTRLTARIWTTLATTPRCRLRRRSFVPCPDFSSHRTFCLTRLFISLDLSSHRTFCSGPQDTYPCALWRGWWWLQRQAVSGQQGCSIKLPLPSQQDNANDCGGLAIAFAVDLCYGIDASWVMYNKTGMKAHLLSCSIEDGKMKQFPSVKKDGRQPHVMKLKLSWVFGFCANCNENWKISLYIKCDAHVSVSPFDF